MAFASPVTMKVFDLQIAQPALLLRDEIGQRKGRDRPGKDHLDFCGNRSRRADASEREEAGESRQKLGNTSPSWGRSTAGA